MTLPTNADRAGWAHDALAGFTAATFWNKHPDTMHRMDLECAIGDLITDLLHYAGQQGFDTDCIMRRAQAHFETERDEEAQP